MGITPSEFRKNQKESDSADTGNLNSYPENRYNYAPEKLFKNITINWPAPMTKTDSAILMASI